MSTFSQVLEGINKAWDSVTEGWREFRELAGHALTRFHAPSTKGDAETAEDRIVSRASRWGLLAAEVADHGSTVQVTLEVPGLQAKDFDLEVLDDILVVRGEKRVARDEHHGHYHIMERAYGTFERAIRLPAVVDNSDAKAQYSAGVLTVTLNKSRSQEARRIPVKAS